MTPLQRSNMPGNQDFSVNARNELECNLCGKVVDHTRQDSVDKHKDTDMHIRNKANPPTMVQQSLFTTMPIKTTARLANAIVVCDWIRSCAAANIPLNASNNPQLRHFFRNHVKIGAANKKILWPVLLMLDLGVRNLVLTFVGLGHGNIAIKSF